MRLALGYLRYRWDEAEPWLLRAAQAKTESLAVFQGLAEYYGKKGDDARRNQFVALAKSLSTGS